ncbi:MAG: phosphatase PAP2 family protein [Thermodesulfobacteriota bacterium]
MKHLRKLDANILKWAYQRPFEDTFVIKSLIFMGDGPFWMLVVLAAAVAGQIFRYAPLHQASILLMFGLMVGNMVFTPLKSRIRRRRPYANKELQKELSLTIQNRDPGHGSKEMESFPSGHVLWTSLCVIIISFRFGLTGLLCFGWMIPAMMYLRPRLGVHYPSDALAGLILGVLCACATLLVSAPLLAALGALHGRSGYIYGYWAFVFVFLALGFRSWLKRV